MAEENFNWIAATDRRVPTDFTGAVPDLRPRRFRSRWLVEFNRLEESIEGRQRNRDVLDSPKRPFGNRGLVYDLPHTMAFVLTKRLTDWKRHSVRGVRGCAC